MCKAVICAVGMMFASAVAADDLSTMSEPELRQVLIETGQNIRATERHNVEVDACTMTTHWWKKRDTGAWILWSSFHFQMDAAMLREDRSNPGVHVLMVLENARDMEDMAMFFFEMLPGTHARYEKPFARSLPKREGLPSPRGDGSSHYYDTSVSFFVRHEGVGIADRARRFSAAYVEYQRRYCFLAG